MSNGYETMQLMSVCAILLTFLLYRKFEAAISFGYILCGLTLLVSMFGESNPSVTQLMPVLSSPLLSIHVVTIMLSYSLLAFVMLNGITAIILRYTRTDCHEQIIRLQIISHIILYPAVFSWQQVSLLSNLGKRIMGKILGMGSQRSMGTHHHAGICSRSTSCITFLFPTPDVLPQVCSNRFFKCTCHILWCQLYYGRYAQLRIRKHYSFLLVILF